MWNRNQMAARAAFELEDGVDTTNDMTEADDSDDDIPFV